MTCWAATAMMMVITTTAITTTMAMMTGTAVMAIHRNALTMVTGIGHLIHPKNQVTAMVSPGTAPDTQMVHRAGWDSLKQKNG